MEPSLGKSLDGLAYPPMRASVMVVTVDAASAVDTAALLSSFMFRLVPSRQPLKRCTDVSGVPVVWFTPENPANQDAAVAPMPDSTCPLDTLVNPANPSADGMVRSRS